jgi:hypothetical protein
MALSEVSATAEVSRGGYRAPGRRGGQQHPPLPEPPPAIEAAAEDFPHEVAYHARRFRTDLSQLSLPATPGAGEPEASESQGDPALFDFFGNLSVLLLAVRAGDLTRAQGAADALEMEVLVERSAGRRGGEPASAHMLDNLSALIGAAQSRDENAARAAALVLATEYRGAQGAPASEPSGPPPDPYAVAEADTGGAAYDTLAHYFDADARVV